MAIQNPLYPNLWDANLLKYSCNNCNHYFIVGMEIAEDKEIHCPYCYSSAVGEVANTTDEMLRDLDLGCLGISYDTRDTDL